MPLQESGLLCTIVELGHHVMLFSASDNLHLHMQDDERLDAMLKGLARRAPDVLSSVGDDSCSTTTSNVSSIGTGRSPTSQAAADLSKIKGAIADMQQLLQQTKVSKKR